MIDHGSEIFPHDIFHRNVMALIDIAEIIDLNNILVGQKRGELGLVDKHGDELGALRKVWQDPLDRDDLLKAGESGLLRKEQFGHAACADFVQEEIFSETGRLTHFGLLIEWVLWSDLFIRGHPAGTTWPRGIVA